MLSRSAEYALSAMVVLASHPKGYTYTTEIAKQTPVPAAYLAKVLQALNRGGLITSRRGVGGGVQLARPPQKISLLEIVNAVEPSAFHFDAARGKAGALLAPLNNWMNATMQKLKRELAATSLASISPQVKR